MVIHFNQDLHKYSNPKLNKDYISATTLLGRYKKPFLRNVVAKNYKRKHNDSRSVEEILKSWDKKRDTACDKGNKYHHAKEIENLITAYKLPLQAKSTVVSLPTLANLPDGIYPEIIVYNHEYCVAGKPDLLIIRGNRIWIYDYKTNKHFIRKKYRCYNNLLYPLQYIPETLFYVYGLQLNLYAWMIAQYGYKVEGLKIIHKMFLDDETIPEECQHYLYSHTEEELKKVKTITITYVPIIIEEILNHYKNGESRKPKFKYISKR